MPDAPPARGPWDLVLLKLSGESLAGPEPFGIHRPTLRSIAEQIADAASRSTRFGIIVSGNSIGEEAAAADGMDRATADYVGMVATVIGIALQDALERPDSRRGCRRPSSARWPSRSSGAERSATRRAASCSGAAAATRLHQAHPPSCAPARRRRHSQATNVEGVYDKD